MIIADTLGERNAAVRYQILRIVRALGRTQVRQLLEQALEVEANGGMMLPDNSRRRTCGGVFFHLAYTTGVPKEGRQLPERGQNKRRIAMKVVMQDGGKKEENGQIASLVQKPKAKKVKAKQSELKKKQETTTVKV